MSIRRLSWRRFRLPLKTPWVTSAGILRFRDGLIVRVEDTAGLHGWGEITPLPGRGSNAQTVNLLRKLTPERLTGLIESAGVNHAASACEWSSSAALAVKAGLDTALCDLRARTQNKPLARLLDDDALGEVAVNAVIDARAAADAASAAARARSEGFRCVKLKVGMAATLTAEIERVGAVREAIGHGVALRLDANQAWKPQQGVEFINNLSSFDLEYVEQPVAAEDLEGLARVRRAAKAPIAADEALTGAIAAKRLLEAEAADFFVIKSAAVGGLGPAWTLIRMAQANGIECVITTGLETGVGTAAALHLAAASRTRRACGLDTLRRLETTLTLNHPAPRNGLLACPVRSGLGVECDEAALDRYALDSRWQE